jgi:hypothetical protein
MLLDQKHQTIPYPINEYVASLYPVTIEQAKDVYKIKHSSPLLVFLIASTFLTLRKADRSKLNTILRQSKGSKCPSFKIISHQLQSMEQGFKYS